MRPAVSEWTDGTFDVTFGALSFACFAFIVICRFDIYPQNSYLV
jgi:hypothetical protein